LIAQSRDCEQDSIVAVQTASRKAIGSSLLAIIFVVFVIVALAVGLFGLLAAAWGGFDLVVVTLFVGAGCLALLGLVGFSRAINARPAWPFIAYWIFALAAFMVLVMAGG
jgi:hypothetical protein